MIVDIATWFCAFWLGALFALFFIHPKSIRSRFLAWKAEARRLYVPPPPTRVYTLNLRWPWRKR